MDKQREGEIALAILQDQVMEEGLKLAGLKRRLGNIAARTGIPIEELKQFVRLGVNELIEKVLK